MQPDLNIMGIKTNTLELHNPLRDSHRRKNNDTVSILFIEDDESVRKQICDALKNNGYCVETATNEKAALEKLNQKSFNTILADIKSPDSSGLDLLKSIKATWPDIPVIMMTDSESIESAIASIKDGAYDYITKPIDLNDIFIAIERGLDKHNLEVQTKQLVEKNKLLESLVVRDSLTGLYNHKYLNEILKIEFGRARRYHDQLSCIMIDIDHFKAVNDTHGHQFGDFVLLSLANIFQGITRDVDFVARYGGEEFFIILPKTSLEGACALGEKLCKVIHAHDFSYEDQSAIITVSAGVSSISDMDVNSKDDLIQHADKALYTAKTMGRNRLCCWNDTELPATEDTLEGIDRVVDFRHKFSQIAIDTKYSFLEIVKDFVRLVDARDDYTINHSPNVSKYAVALAKTLGVSEEGINVIKNAALLHDIGKVCVPQNILLKKGKLTESEYDLVKKHSAIGVSILSQAPFFSKEAPIVLHHHEWYDGSGYPYGLKGAGIPLGSRILNIAEAYDAMSSERVYRDKFSKDAIIKEFKKLRSKQFDPEMVNTFLKLIEDGFPII